MAQSKVAKNSITLREARKVLKVPNENDYSVRYNRKGVLGGFQYVRAIILEAGISHRAVKGEMDYSDGVLFYCARQNKLLLGYALHNGYVTYKNQDIVELL